MHSFDEVQGQRTGGLPFGLGQGFQTWRRHHSSEEWGLTIDPGQCDRDRCATVVASAHGVAAASIRVENRLTIQHCKLSQPANQRPRTIAMSLVIRGQVAVYAGSRQTLAVAGDVLLLSSDFSWTKEIAPYTEELFLCTTLQEAGEATFSCNELTGPELLIPSPMGLAARELMVSVHRNFAHLQPHEWLATARACLSLLQKSPISPPQRALIAPSEDGALARLRTAIDADFTNPTVDPAYFAKKLGCSVRKVHRLLQPTGQSLGSVLLEKRLCRAHHLIMHSPLCSITDVAYGSGFSDLSHFARSFRAKFGCCARELREQVRIAHSSK